MSAWRRLRWVGASMGRKPGAEVSRALLVAAEDLPGAGWHVIDERTWRTGEADRTPDWAQRARAMGSVTAWRSFERSDRQRWVWCQVTPLATVVDVEVAMSEVSGRSLVNLRADVEVVGSAAVQRPLPKGVDHRQDREDHTTSSRGDGLVLMSAVAVGTVLGVLCASSRGAAWTWPELEALIVVWADRMAASSDRPPERGD